MARPGMISSTNIETNRMIILRLPRLCENKSIRPPRHENASFFFENGLAYIGAWDDSSYFASRCSSFQLPARVSCPRQFPRQRWSRNCQFSEADTVRACKNEEHFVRLRNGRAKRDATLSPCWGGLGITTPPLPTTPSLSSHRLGFEYLQNVCKWWLLGGFFVDQTRAELMKWAYRNPVQSASRLRSQFCRIALKLPAITPKGLETSKNMGPMHDGSADICGLAPNKHYKVVGYSWLMHRYQGVILGKALDMYYSQISKHINYLSTIRRIHWII